VKVAEQSTLLAYVAAPALLVENGSSCPAARVIAAEDGSQIEACRTRESEICTKLVKPVPVVAMKRVPCVVMRSKGGVAGSTSMFEEAEDGPS
jgi:hypothetical protein